MILLRADHQLTDTFEKLIETMKIPVKWNGIFVVLDNYMILQGEVRSLFFHFDTRKVATNIIEIPVGDENIKQIDQNVRLQNAINMILYAFGKWGTIKGLKVDKNYEQLSKLFSGIMKEYSVEPEYTKEHLRFYRGGIRITYEDVIQMALEYSEDTAVESEEKSRGLWRKIVWKKQYRDFLHVETTLKERRATRLGRNFYMVGYLCPECGEKLHMVVYPHGKEFRIETEEGGVLLARATACDSCHIFYTPRPKKLLIEGDIYAMDFGEDTDAYEDYLELLGRDGAKVSNYHCNEYVDKRKQAEAVDSDDDETLEELCGHLPELSELELRKIEARIEEGFYPDESAKKYEAQIRRQSAQKKKLRGQRNEAESEENYAEDGEATERKSSDCNRKSRDFAERASGSQQAGREETAKSTVRSTADSQQAGREEAAKSTVSRQAAGNQTKKISDSQRAAGNQTKKMSVSQQAAGKEAGQEIIVTPQEREAARSKYEARISVLERYSERQLKELKGQIEREKALLPEEKAVYLKQVDEKIIRERVKNLSEKVAACEGKNYVLLKRMAEEVEHTDIPAEEKLSLLDRLKTWKGEQAEREVRQLMEKMPPVMDRAQYQQFVQRMKDYEEVDLAPYEEKLRDRREAAEKQEVANIVKRARKITREDLTDLMGKLRESDFLPELVLPYIEKLEDKVKEMDAAAIELIIPNPMQMTFEEGIQAYGQIESGEFLPELKTDALKMLSKRLAKLKTDECELLVQKLKTELTEAGLAENDRHHFYPARKVLLHQATSEETELIDFAMASYAAGNGLFEYPILVVDTTRSRTGKEGIILTPDHLYISTMLSAYGIPIASIAGISASARIINKGLYVHQRNGEKAKIPYAVDGKEIPLFAEVLDDFIHYLQEKPDSRNLMYLAKEKHETICCFRCGYTYKGDGVCPKCGYQNND